ncbi:MAG: ionic transporter y4hA [Pseudomonadales bacterium]|jgi:Ca2+:H+ antiporter|nr:ionic transporter y4hA [Pseudomonadales bacterium]
MSSDTAVPSPEDKYIDWSLFTPALALLLALVFKDNTAAWAGVILGAALLVGVLASVHHAEVVAARVGEPFGAVVLALAVTVIELGLIVSIMLGAQPEPTLVRDAIHAVVVLVLHGLAGLCIVVGALKHREQEFHTQGAQAYLTVLLPMVSVTLILPNHTVSSPGPYYSGAQLAFVSICCLLLWLAFTFVQTVRNRDHFIPPRRKRGGATTNPRPTTRAALIALGLLLIALAAVVLLAKAVSPFIQHGVAAIDAPPSLVGVIVAAIVLLPEATTAVRAALADQLQTSINLALGSAVASIGLTVPTVAVIAWWTDHPLELGVSEGGAILLGLSFLMAMITYGIGRASLLSGVVHLILLCMWLAFLVAP